MKSWAITDKGIVRRQNQDTYYAFCDNSSGTAVLIVCDGMGGAKAGNVASQLATSVFADQLKGKLSSSVPWDELEFMAKSALDMSNTAVFERSSNDLDCTGMGTTLVAAVVCGDNTLVINVGDSRAYRISEGAIQQITRDHSVVEDMVQRGEITREQSLKHPNKNLITRAVGTVEKVDCDIFKLENNSFDYILLCSDGLTNLVSEDEILYQVAHSESLEFCCEKLLGLALTRGAPDNVTIVLFQK